MKKLVLVIGLMFFLRAPAFAVCNYLDRCPLGGSNILSSPTSLFANATGANYVVEQFVQNMIKNELKKLTGQDFDSVVKVFDLQSLLEGKFRSLSVSGNNVEIQGFHFSSIKVQTLCNFNHINLKSKPISLKENLVFEVWAELSAADLINTLIYKNYSNELSKLNLSALGISSFKVYPYTINIENNKLYFTINAVPMEPYLPLDINIGADLKVQDGQIIKSHFDYINLYSGFDLTQNTNLLNSLNNLNFPFDLYPKTTGPLQPKAEIQLMNLEIINNKILLKGIVFLPKKST